MYLVGIDEVGRGAIAGPLVVGVVVLDQDILGLRDSKVLSRNQRLKLDVEIRQKALFVGLGWVSVIELERIGLSQALTLASTRALSKLKLHPVRYVLDGNYNYLADRYTPLELVVKGDASVASISAASIVAKVARDSYMSKLATKLPEYGFEQHVGYATKSHLQALANYGVTPLHRKSFSPVKSLLKT